MLLGLINIRIDIIFIPKGSRLCCMSKIALLVDPVLFCWTIDLSGFITPSREVGFYVSYGSSTNGDFTELKISKISDILDNFCTLFLNCIMYFNLLTCRIICTCIYYSNHGLQILFFTITKYMYYTGAPSTVTKSHLP